MSTPSHAASPEAPRNVHTFSRRATACLATSAYSGYCEPLAGLALPPVRRREARPGFFIHILCNKSVEYGMDGNRPTGPTETNKEGPR